MPENWPQAPGSRYEPCLWDLEVLLLMTWGQYQVMCVCPCPSFSKVPSVESMCPEYKRASHEVLWATPGSTWAGGGHADLKIYPSLQCGTSSPLSCPVCCLGHVWGHSEKMEVWKISINFTSDQGVVLKCSRECCREDIQRGYTHKSKKSIFCWLYDPYWLLTK